MVHSPMGPPVDLNLYRLRVAAPARVFFPRIAKSTTLGHLDDLAVLPALLWKGRAAPRVHVRTRRWTVRHRSYM